MSSLPASTTPAGLAATPAPQTASLPSVPGARPVRWTRDEYHRLGELGFFDGRRVELINGEIIEVSPQSSEHGWALLQIAGLLEDACGEGRHVRSQLPLAAGAHGEAEPAIAVVRGTRHEYLVAHPTTALLAVEVAKTSQAFDKTTKAELYASAKIEDYWVLDLERRELTVFRKPTEAADSPFGWRYALTEVVGEAGAVAPLAAASAEIKVADMLPPIADA